MNAIDLLLSRKSHNRLAGKAPSKEQVELLMQAALRAADHAQLKPWRYQVYQGDGLLRLSDYFVAVSVKENPQLGEEKKSKIKAKALRAPMIIVAISKTIEHAKVPEIEQVLSAGASVQNLIMAAHFLGIGAIWRTGNLAFNRDLMDQLGLAENESIVGFVYLGEEQGNKRPVAQIDQSDFVQWI